MNPEKKAILVTGAAGFIGSNLTQTLLHRGYRVIGFDNLSQGDLANLDLPLSHPDFSLIQADIRDEQAVIEAAKACSAIVHLAAYKIPRYSDAYDTLEINGKGAENVVKASVQTRAKLVAASTSDVYGKNPQVPFSENDSDSVIGNPYIRRWAYAISKMYEEQLLFAAHERYGIDVVLLRFFGGFGPHQNLSWWGGPQAVFINCALDNEEMPIHGDGQQQRTFTYVDDHVDGIIRAIEKSAANNKVFNIGSQQEISIAELAKLIWRLVNGDTPPKIKWIPYETFGKYEDVRRRIPDITQARQLLGFEPQTELETGLRKTIAWQIERRIALGIATSSGNEAP